MLSELELKAYSLEWGNPSFATYVKGISPGLLYKGSHLLNKGSFYPGTWSSPLDCFTTTPWSFALSCRAGCLR